MYQPNPNQSQNKTDQVAGDFFHSKTWKIILTIWISLFGIALLIACCLVVIIPLGLGGSIIGILVGIWEVFITPVGNYLTTPPFTP